MYVPLETFIINPILYIITIKITLLSIHIHLKQIATSKRAIPCYLELVRNISLKRLLIESILYLVI